MTAIFWQYVLCSTMAICVSLFLYAQTSNMVSQMYKPRWHASRYGKTRLNKRNYMTNEIFGMNVSASRNDIQAMFERSLLNSLKEKSTNCLNGGRKKEELTKLSGIVQARIYRLQHPKDCQTARKLVTSLSHCGYTSQVHRLMVVFMYAYASNRTLIFVDKGWWFNTKQKNEWEDFHIPLSDTCRDPSGNSIEAWDTKVNQENIQVLQCWDCIEKLYPRPKVVKGIPSDIASVLVKYHRRPLHWWASQFVYYIMRLQPWLKKYIETIRSNMFNMKHPLVGIHIRTTDKVTTMDADLFPVEDYFNKVDLYSQQLQIENLSVYLATDNASIVSGIRKKYAEYAISYDVSIAKTASILRQRFTKQSLIGIITDVTLLSMSDYLVCTFSSNVGRAVYELMQATRGDISHCVVSLDSEYWFMKHYEPSKIAIEDNTLTNISLPRELELKIGDIIFINRKGRRAADGFSEGTNLRTKTHGIYPLKKAVDYIYTYSLL